MDKFTVFWVVILFVIAHIVLSLYTKGGVRNYDLTSRSKIDIVNITIKCLRVLKNQQILRFFAFAKIYFIYWSL